ncbi:MAG TPA: AAA family ATPase [Candidatus Paceibacterota bacterium]|nr:AAA family ATPase [Candidatus Paceibacterota bacterium]
MKTPKKLFLIALFGRRGSGKTTLADLFHNELSYTAHVGVDHIKRFISEFREISSHNTISRKVVNAMASEYLKNGISVIVEQGMSRKELEDLRDIALVYQADFLVYRLEADEKTLAQRVEDRTTKLNKPVIAQDDLAESARIFNENDYLPTRVLDSGAMDAHEKANLIFKDLGFDEMC